MKSAWQRLAEGPLRTSQDEPMRSIGAGVSAAPDQAGQSQEPISLTVGRKQLEFTVQEFLDLIRSGQLAKMVQSGQVRKLPGV